MPAQASLFCQETEFDAGCGGKCFKSLCWAGQGRETLSSGQPGLHSKTLTQKNHMTTIQRLEFVSWQEAEPRGLRLPRTSNAGLLCRCSQTPGLFKLQRGDMYFWLMVMEGSVSLQVLGFVFVFWEVAHHSGHVGWGKAAHLLAGQLKRGKP